MDIKIIADTLDELQYSTTTPETQTSLLIPGATPVFASGDYGALLFQHLATSQNSIWYGDYTLIRKAAFKTISPLPYLELHFTFKNHCSYYLEGMGDVSINPGQFNLTYLPYLESQTFFHAGEFQTFDVHITRGFLQRAALHYVEVNGFLNIIDKHRPAHLSCINHHITPAMLLIIRQIKSCELQGMFREFYLDNKITELLILVLNVIMNHHADAEIKLNARDVECLYHAKSILAGNIDAPPSLVQLAHLASTNECKLKKGFKQLFGTTVFGYLTDLRMEKGLQLLKETDMSIAAIAWTLGYANQGTFTAVFNRKLGYPPSVARK